MEKLIIRINCTIGILICQSVLNLSIYGTFDVPALFLHGRILEYKRKLCVLLHKKKVQIKKQAAFANTCFCRPSACYSASSGDFPDFESTSPADETSSQ